MKCESKYAGVLANDGLLPQLSLMQAGETLNLEN